jgi:hypothetical protein
MQTKCFPEYFLKQALFLGLWMPIAGDENDASQLPPFLCYKNSSLKSLCNRKGSSTNAEVVDKPALLRQMSA